MLGIWLESLYFAFDPMFRFRCQEQAEFLFLEIVEDCTQVRESLKDTHMFKSPQRTNLNCR